MKKLASRSASSSTLNGFRPAGPSALFNRRRFHGELAEHAQCTRRRGGTTTLLLLDLDGLNAVNDDLGHAAGDALIAQVAETIAKRLRPTDVAGRLGGNEFGALLPDSTPAGATQVADGLLHAIRNIEVRDDDDEIAASTVSIGLAFSSEPLDDDGQALLADADDAMSDAKREGGDRVSVCSRLGDDPGPESAREAGAPSKELGLRPSSFDVAERRAHLLDSVAAAVIATDADGAVTDWNEAAENMYGWPREDVLGKPITEVTVGPEDEELANEILAEVTTAGFWEGDFDVRHRDGSSFPAHVRNKLITDKDGARVGIVGVSVDISERVERERIGLHEREYLRAITESMAEGLFALDAEGRLTFLNPAAEQLLGWDQHELEGEVMHDLTHYQRADGSPLARESCGILPARRDGKIVRVNDDVFTRKDGSMLPVAYTSAPFETEHGVRGSVVVFSDITARKRQQRELQVRIDALAWVGRIREAVDRDLLQVYSQPIVDLSTGEEVLHELLVRMQGEDGTMISPGAFLPIAEEDGVIVEIDRWMLCRAVHLAARGMHVSVNISAHSLGGTAAVECLRLELDKTGVDASRIVIELTETALVSDTEAASVFVAAVKELGCRIALDDFGTGYGGFTYLKRLPIDILKIDIEFVRDLTSSAPSRAVVQAVVSLAQSFGHTTIAEGVEDEATAQALRDLGVDLAQGYLFARPAPVAEALAKGVRIEQFC